MKKLTIVYNILKNNIFANVIIIFQIFVILFNIVPLLNQLEKNNKHINLLKDSSLKNAMYYMNNELITYEKKDTSEIVSNLDELKLYRDRLIELAKSSNVVKSISPTKMFDGYYYNGVTALYWIYDIYSMETIKPFIIKGEIPKYDNDVMEILISNNIFGGKYDIGDEIILENDYGKIKAKISGIFDEKKASFINLSNLSNRLLTVSSIFTEQRINNSKNILMFVTDDNPLIKKITNPDDIYGFQKQIIVYYKDNATLNQIKNFEDKIITEKIGFINNTGDMLELQEKENFIKLSSKLDYIIMLVIVIFITLISISYFLQKNLRNELMIYLINGARKKDILFIFVAYFLFIYLFSILVYSFFIKIGKMNLISNKIISLDIFFDFDISSKQFFTLSVIFFLISVFVSYLPIKIIYKNKLIENLKDV